MKIALVQMRVSRDRPTDNLENVKKVLKRPELQDADLVVFPALVMSGRLGPAALARPGLELQYNKVFKDFLEISAQHSRTALASSLLSFDADDPAGPEASEPFELAFIARGGEANFQVPQLEDEPEEGFQVAGQVVSIHPSWDTPDYIEDSGADVVVSLRSHFYEGRPYFPAQEIEAARAWRLNVSAVGGEGPYIYDGACWVYDPSGQLKGWTQGFENAVIIMDTASNRLPTLNPLPRRDPLTVLQEALITGLRDFVQSAGGEKVLLGLSGGLDSALVAFLAVEALGADKVLGVAMPSEYSSPESLVLARALADKLKISLLTIPIDGIRESFTRSFLLTPKRSEKDGNLADENIQARIRAVLLMYLANREDRLLLNTGNKSEAAMGYSTLYGDTCGAICPLGDVYKTRLYELARHINRRGEIIPEGIISRPPSAELRPDQKDEDTLPPYPVLDDILERHLEGAQSGSRVAREGGHSAMTVAWVLSTLKKSAFKRAQEPFSLIASSCPLGGQDWPRWPV